jgi:hypothetical protein
LKNERKLLWLRKSELFLINQNNRIF